MAARDVYPGHDRDSKGITLGSAMHAYRMALRHCLCFACVASQETRAAIGSEETMRLVLYKGEL